MIADISAQGSTQGQRILRLYHFYRLSIGLALILLISSNLDEQLLEAHVTPRTRAIVVVHYGGVGCEMDLIGDRRPDIYA